MNLTPFMFFRCLSLVIVSAFVEGDEFRPKARRIINGENVFWAVSCGYECCSVCRGLWGDL